MWWRQNMSKHSLQIFKICVYSLFLSCVCVCVRVHALKIWCRWLFYASKYMNRNSFLVHIAVKIWISGNKKNRVFMIFERFIPIHVSIVETSRRVCCFSREIWRIHFLGQGSGKWDVSLQIRSAASQTTFGKQIKKHTFFYVSAHSH